MADLIGTAHQGTASSGQGSARAKFDEAAASTKSLGEQAMSTGRDLADKAKDIAESSTDAIKGQASDLVDAAKDVASQATDKIKDAVNDRKSSGAEYVGSLADTMRRAAREFDTDLPLAGTYIRKAASQIEGVSDHIRTGNELVTLGPSGEVETVHDLEPLAAIRLRLGSTQPDQGATHERPYPLCPRVLDRRAI